MGLLVLLGVVHKDPKGADRLWESLQEIRPQALGLEMSPLGLLWREKRSSQLLERLDGILKEFPVPMRTQAHIRLIREALRLPFEYVTCSHYAASRGVPLHLMDLNWISREELPRYETEILTRENLSNLLAMGRNNLQDTITAAYARARRCLQSNTSLQQLGINPPWSCKTGMVRESFLACRVRNMALRYDPFLYVGGWVHLAEDPKGHSLASRLRDLKPLRILLAGPDPSR